MGEEELKWLQLAHHQLMSHRGPHFSPHSTAKTNYKAHSSGRMVPIGISDVVIASVYSEKTRLKKLMTRKMIIIINIIIIIIISQEKTVFSGHQKFTSAMKLRSEN